MTLLKALNNYVEEKYDGEWDEMDWGDHKTDNHSFKCIEQQGGEGEGSHYHLVIEVTDLNTKESKCFMVEGYYNSWEGVDWCDAEPFEVVKKIKSVEYYGKP